MSEQRPTIRPVTLGRLVDVADRCVRATEPVTTDVIADELDVTQRRARETLLEARRIGLLHTEDGNNSNAERFDVTGAGEAFITAVRRSDWAQVSNRLEAGSPQYSAFLSVIEEGRSGTTNQGSMNTSEVLESLKERAKDTPYTYNQTSLDVLTGWGERLNVVGRNAFTENFYPMSVSEVGPATFAEALLNVYDELEATSGINLSQRYLSIPRLREHVCGRLCCSRATFDEMLVQLCADNIGSLELSGGPIDTAAKESPRGIRRVELSEGDGLVATTQTTDRVLSGLEQYGKRYYYLAVFDRDLNIDI